MGLLPSTVFAEDLSLAYSEIRSSSDTSTILLRAYCASAEVYML